MTARHSLSSLGVVLYCCLYYISSDTYRIYIFRETARSRRLSEAQEIAIFHFWLSFFFFWGKCTQALEAGLLGLGIAGWGKWGKDTSDFVKFFLVFVALF